MSRRLQLALLLILAVLGLLDSLYLSSMATKDAPLFCDIGAGLDGCNIVAQSPYSKLVGIPLAYFGVVFYVLLLFAVLLAYVKNTVLVHKALLAVAGIGALFSVVFLYIQIVLIQALCIYCIVSAAIAFLALFLSWRLDRIRPNASGVLP